MKQMIVMKVQSFYTAYRICKHL